ncbi:MAG: hypothetical protein WDZ61_00500 [Parcubacteria group bacterium]
MNGEEKSGVDKLRDKLYSRARYQEPTGERTLGEPHEDAPEAAEKWDSPELDEMLKQERRAPEPYPVMKKFFLFALVFFIGAIAVTAFIFLGGSNFVSSKNVDIKLVGPTSISAGDILELGITVSNKNNADLEVANLSIQYPQGSHDAEAPEQTITYVREELGEIGAGREVTRTARAILFGEEGEVKQVKVSVEYTIKGSNATFYKDKVYEIAIGDSPIGMLISAPEEVNSGDSFTTTITLSSASEEILRNVVVRAEYPPGYTPIESDPPAINDHSFWLVGDVTPGSKKTLTLQGRLIGENEEERTFHFHVGVGDAGLSGTILGTTLLSSLETVKIARPSVNLSMELGGDSSFEHDAVVGDSVQANVRLQNNLVDKIINPKIQVRLSGQALDESAIFVQGGTYDPQTNTISWNILSSSGQPEILPGSVAQTSFRLNSKDTGSLPSTITLEVTFTGQSVGAGGGSIQSRLERTVRVLPEGVTEVEEGIEE